MSTPFGKNVLTFNDVVKQLRTAFETFSDRRTGKNTSHTMTDTGLSAFSVFFMPSPSFLDSQRTMQETQGKNNAHTLFGIFQIPTDTHIRRSGCALAFPDVSKLGTLKYHVTAGAAI